MDLQYLIPALRIILGLLYIVTAALKFPNLKGFSIIVASYGIIPRKFVKSAAYAQPIIEFIVGAWLLSGKNLFYASIAGLLLMIVANIFVLSALISKKKMENCGCYGVNIKIPLSWKKFAENLVWTALFIILAIATK